MLVFSHKRFFCMNIEFNWGLLCFFKECNCCHELLIGEIRLFTNFLYKIDYYLAIPLPDASCGDLYQAYMSLGQPK